MSERPAEGAAKRPGTDPGVEDTATRPAVRDRGTGAGDDREGQVGGAATATATRAKEAGSRAASAARTAAARMHRNPQQQPRGSRRAQLRLTRVDPWSVMKVSFLLSIAFGVVLVVAVLMVWSVLGAAGVWESINATVREIVGGEEAASFDVENYLGTSRVLGFTMIVAAVDVILLTAIATLAAFLYNMAATLLGGLEVTLTEDT